MFSLLESEGFQNFQEIDFGAVSIKKINEYLQKHDFDLASLGEGASFPDGIARTANDLESNFNLGVCGSETINRRKREALEKNALLQKKKPNLCWIRKEK